ncbi:MAG: sigma-70 family RNA polymerase sigma factor [bacterium]
MLHLDRLQALEDDAWKEVERQFAGRLYAYVARRVADQQAREDVLQEVFLGAVRGIVAFDRVYSLEQYLFGICRNRTIDHLRRRRDATLSRPTDGTDESDPLDELAVEPSSPGSIVGERDLQTRTRTLLVKVLRDWVQETWGLGEFKRLMVIEALFLGGWRNRDTWEHMGLSGERAVAGVKFRALARMRALAGQGVADRMLLDALSEEEGAIGGAEALRVSDEWAASHASCPARHWLARHLNGSLEEGPRSFVDFHLSQMECPWCLANLDDLEQERVAPQILMDRVHASTMNYLRSRTLPKEPS